MRHALLVPAVIAAGCTGPDLPTGQPAHGEVSTCLGGPEGEGEGSRQRWDGSRKDLEGVIVGFDVQPLATYRWLWCDRPEPAQHLQFRDDAGDVWYVGWSIADDRGRDVTPAVDITQGDRVRVTVWSDGFGEQLLMRDEHGAFVAAASRTMGDDSTPLDDALPEIRVSLGPIVDERAHECGRLIGRALVFDTDPATELTPFRRAGSSVDGADTVVFAIQAEEQGADRNRSTCVDWGWMGSPLWSWAAFRQGTRGDG